MEVEIETKFDCSGHSFLPCPPSWELLEQTKGHNFRTKPRTQLRQLRRAPFREGMAGESQQGREAPVGDRASESLAASSMDPAASQDCVAWSKCSAWARLCCLSARVLASWQIQASGYQIVDFQMGFNILLQETPWESLPSEAVCRRFGRVEATLVKNYLHMAFLVFSCQFVDTKYSKFQFQIVEPADRDCWCQQKKNSIWWRMFRLFGSKKERKDGPPSPEGLMTF